MNALAPQRQVSILPTLPEAPRLSRPVGHALSVALQPVLDRGMFGEKDPGYRSPPPLLGSAEWEEAQRAAAVLDEMLAPVTGETVTAWLVPLNLAGGNPLSPTDFRLRATAIAELVADLPEQAFTAETRRKVSSKGFFPSAHEVRAAIAPIADDWRRKRDALRGLHRAVAPKAGKPDPIETPEERAAYAEINARTVQALKDQLAEKVQAERREQRAPAHFSAEQRIVEYHKAGQTDLAHRIAKANHLELDEVLDRARQGLLA